MSGNYVYLSSEETQFAADAPPAAWVVGFFDPTGLWRAERYCKTREQAAARVNYLNGGDGCPAPVLEGQG